MHAAEVVVQRPLATQSIARQRFRQPIYGALIGAVTLGLHQDLRVTLWRDAAMNISRSPDCLAALNFKRLCLGDEEVAAKQWQQQKIKGHGGKLSVREFAADGVCFLRADSVAFPE